MRRFATPTHTFTTDIDLTTLKTLWLSYVQGNTIVRKTLEDVTISGDGNTVFSVTLSQEETSAFKVGKVGIQARGLTHTGVSLVTDILYVPVERVLEGGVMT